MDEQTRKISAALSKKLGAIGRAANSIGEQLVESFQDHLGLRNPGWAPLAPSTQKTRIRQGYAPDEPLLRSGTLRDSFSYATSVSESEVEIVAGIRSNVVKSFPYDKRPKDIAQIMIRHEQGTATEPPRPLLPLVADTATKALKQVFEEGETAVSVETGVVIRAL